MITQCITKMKEIFSILMAVLTFMVSVFGFSTQISDDYKEYKNVILMIGDGMGEVILESAKQAYDIDELVMETMPVRGQSETRSFSKTTDSSAGATALACGIRTINGYVGVYGLDPFGLIVTSPSLSEIAISAGKSAGVVTTDSTSGATPASFSAHAQSRDAEKKISKGQLKSNLDLIWGGVSKSINEENCSENGYKYISTKQEMATIDYGTKSFAQFPSDDLANTQNTDSTPTLEEMSVKAVEILSQNENGFFLMIEAAHIDKNEHANIMDMAVHHVMEFDKAIAAMLDFAETDGETLVVVTADHETGGVSYDAENDSFYFTKGSHTSANVPLFISATDAGFTHGDAVKNKKIGTQLARVMGFDESMFPTPFITFDKKAA